MERTWFEAFTFHPIIVTWSSAVKNKTNCAACALLRTFYSFYWYLIFHRVVICPLFKIYYVLTYPKGKFNVPLTYP